MYTLYKFGNITLPASNTSYTITPVPAQLSMIQTTAGAFDNDGFGRRKQQFPFPLTYTAAITEDVLANSRAIMDALRSAVGIKAFLYRKADDNDAIHRCEAVLTGMPEDRPYEQRSHFIFQLDFQQTSPWIGAKQGAGWTFDSGIFFDDSRNFDETPPATMTDESSTLSWTNNGNLPTHNVIIDVVVGSDPLIQFLTYNDTTNCWLNWQGSIPAGGHLQIDAGACSVLIDGVDAYPSLQILEPFHKNQYWFEVVPGNNTIVAYRQGGGSDSTVSYVFDEVWA